MSTESNTTEDSTSRIGASSPWRVTKAITRPGFRLHVEFVDGTAGEVEMERLIKAQNAGVFASLRNPEIFEKVQVENGAATWPGEIDLAPDAMYDAIRANGKWVVE
jgi:hypothetical protein